MEVINPDWNIYVREVNTFYEKCEDDKAFADIVLEFDEYYKDNQH